MRIEPILSKLLALAGLVALLPWGARAEGPPSPADLVKAELVAEAASIAPGTTLWLDLHLCRVKPGCAHVYWLEPRRRDFLGLPTTIDWETADPDLRPWAHPSGRCRSTLYKMVSAITATPE